MSVDEEPMSGQGDFVKSGSGQGDGAMPFAAVEASGQGGTEAPGVADGMVGLGEASGQGAELGAAAPAAATGIVGLGEPEDGQGIERGLPAFI
mmetsp:Transcript_85471/g.183214  ORF Transcript_85471/g.183214 Transcript_85471/m.183214 type:complete len:93 (+) Transcript_85471:30-308(+)